MKRVILVHRWSGGANDDWRPWLGAELEKKGFQVLTPSMPDTEVPVIEKWVSHLATIVGTPDSETYFIGHSIGCQAILRYLESIDQPVGGAMFVAGWFKLEHLEMQRRKRSLALGWRRLWIFKKSNRFCRHLPL